MKTYTVTITREGKFYLANVEGLQGAHTFARSAERLALMVEDMVALVTESTDFALIYSQEDAK